MTHVSVNAVPFTLTDRTLPLNLDLLRRCWVLAGPTASGKSAVGLELAERIGAEILSLDSMAVYRGMDIGTAKPSETDRSRIPHHLVDLVEPHESFSVADFLAAAEVASSEIASRDRVPLFVGGTGMYLRSLMRGVFEGPGASPEVRQRLELEAASFGSEQLHERLRILDPVTAQRLHANDVRRVIRALEVAEVTGRPLSEQQSQPPLPLEQRPQQVYWLSPPRKWLHRRINDRVDWMMQAGLLEETERLLHRSEGLGQTARQALGYRELIDYIEGNISLDEAVELIKLRTRQFAKRQHTWFRNLEECRAIEIDGSESPGELAERLICS